MIRLYTTTRLMNLIKKIFPNESISAGQGQSSNNNGSNASGLSSLVQNNNTSKPFLKSAGTNIGMIISVLIPIFMCLI